MLLSWVPIMLTLGVKASDPTILNIAHTFCALISHVVVVGNYDTMNLQFLLAPVQIINEK
jgi:hypothetical protein